MDSITPNNYQISVNYPLTKIPQAAILENAPGRNTTRHNSRQLDGGNVTNTQPPFMRGFFMPATFGDCTFLPGVVDYKIPSCGKIHSVSIETSRSTRQSYNCHHSRQFDEVNAMQTAITNRTVAPATAVRSLCSLPNNHRCIFPFHILQTSITQARQQRQRNGRGTAYFRLLDQFHKAILTAFITETGGNLSEMSRLLGIHRETVRKYASLAEIEISTPQKKEG